MVPESSRFFCPLLYPEDATSAAALVQAARAMLGHGQSSLELRLRPQ